MASGRDGRIVVVGGCGELGWEVVKAASASPTFLQVVATYYRTKPLSEQTNCPRVRWVQVDCGNHAAVRNVLAAATAVVYCAVPKHGGANGKGGDDVRRGIVDDVVFAARVCAETGTRFIAISTDLVFDGVRNPGEHYTERDDVCPTNVVRVTYEESFCWTGRFAGRRYINVLTRFCWL
jgi:dTDP-4-dehydrorhamnose reductase